MKIEQVTNCLKKENLLENCYKKQVPVREKPESAFSFLLSEKVFKFYVTSEKIYSNFIAKLISNIQILFKTKKFYSNFSVIL